MKRLSLVLMTLFIIGLFGFGLLGCNDETSEEEEQVTEEEVSEDEPEPENDEPPSDNDVESPADHVYSDDPDHEEDSTEYSELKVTTGQEQQVTGDIALLEGASIRMETEPENGIATVDDTGSWEYTPEPGFTGEDKFTLAFDIEDDREEIKAILVTIEEAETDPEDEEIDDDTLPSAGGGIAIASIIALWLFIMASFSLRKGVFLK